MVPNYSKKWKVWTIHWNSGQDCTIGVFLGLGILTPHWILKKFKLAWLIDGWTRLSLESLRDWKLLSKPKQNHSWLIFGPSIDAENPKWNNIETILFLDFNINIQRAKIIITNNSTLLIIEFPYLSVTSFCNQYVWASPATQSRLK